MKFIFTLFALLALCVSSQVISSDQKTNAGMNMILDSLDSMCETPLTEQERAKINCNILEWKKQEINDLYKLLNDLENEEGADNLITKINKSIKKKQYKLAYLVQVSHLSTILQMQSTGATYNLANTSKTGGSGGQINFYACRYFINI